MQTMLGRRDVATTKGIYLEPFLGLDIHFLLAHHANNPETGPTFDLVRGHPLPCEYPDSRGTHKVTGNPRGAPQPV